MVTSHKSKQRQLLGLALIVLPTFGLIITIVAYAISSFVTSAIIDAKYSESSVTTPILITEAEMKVFYTDAEVHGPSIVEVYTNLMGTILSAAGVICLLGMFTAVPYGVYLLSKSDVPKSVK